MCTSIASLGAVAGREVLVVGRIRRGQLALAGLGSDRLVVQLRARRGIATGHHRQRTRRARARADPVAAARREAAEQDPALAVGAAGRRPGLRGAATSRAARGASPVAYACLHAAVSDQRRRPPPARRSESRRRQQRSDGQQQHAQPRESRIIRAPPPSASPAAPTGRGCLHACASDAATRVSGRRCASARGP